MRGVGQGGGKGEREEGGEEREGGRGERGKGRRGEERGNMLNK